MLHICGHFGRKTGLRKLAMAGGVALNCTANGRLLQSGLFDDIYVQPAAGDDGSALGAALWSASRNGGVKKRPDAGSLPRPRALASRNRQGSR